MADRVPHSTDWLNTKLPDLASLEAAFRCHVCKDFYSTPMLTACSHTFCSLCIRRALSSDGKCPLCRSTQQESKLRSCVPLGEAIEAFIRVRPAALEVAGGRVEQPARAISPKRKPFHDSRPISKRLRTSSRPVGLEDKGPEFNTHEGDLSCAAGGKANGTLSDHIEYERQNLHLPGDGLVACPICSRRMKEIAVSSHIDNSCPGGPLLSAKSTQPSSAFSAISSRATAPAERLPAINYSMLKDNALRKKLADLGIPNHGPRSIIENRHKEWVALWNANCDSSHPQKRSILLQQLDTWERTLGTLASSSSKSSVIASKIRDKDFDASAWSVQYSENFRDLISQAKRSRHVETSEGGSEALCQDVPPNNSDTKAMERNSNATNILHTQEAED